MRRGIGGRGKSQTGGGNHRARQQSKRLAHFKLLGKWDGPATLPACGVKTWATPVRFRASSIHQGIGPGIAAKTGP
jgi:hypothetical protein